MLVYEKTQTLLHVGPICVERKVNLDMRCNDGWTKPAKAQREIAI